MADTSRRPSPAFTQDPLLVSLLTEEFNRVYLDFMERSRVNLSDEYRESVRRTVCTAILPKIHHETLEHHEYDGSPLADERDFRDFLRREIGALLSRFLRGGVFDQLVEA
jgi:hypothetical protein